MTKTRKIVLLVVALVFIALLAVEGITGGSGNMVDCPDCENGHCPTCDGTMEVLDKESGELVACPDCEDGTCGTCGGEAVVRGSLWALLPPVIAIGLALITKEVYSSLFFGILAGGLMAARYSPFASLDAIMNDGLIAAAADTAGIFIFLVILGIIVSLVNKTGASAAFGKWAETHIKTKAGAMLATFVLGVLIFIDDYFNCLTVGSVMSPVTDKHHISRVKLAYLIDATAAPVCMIAPISSWAAAVSGCVDIEGMSDIQLFVSAIPFNFYSLLTFVFIITLAIMGYDYGKMADFEIKARAGESDKLPGDDSDAAVVGNGVIWDLIIPIAVLIVACVFALIYNGGFFDAESKYFHNFVGAFGNTDAYGALPWGGLIALVISAIYFLLRRVINFNEMMKSVPSGFIAMVPAILILTFATALKNITGLLGAKYFVGNMMQSFPTALLALLPAVIFLVACVLAFATGTSWGTFGILIPIVSVMFEVGNPLLFVGISACLAGAVCGDHCSPISDTTIMASAGARCNHVAHVETQLPYAITVAAISFVMFVLAGFVPNAFICLPVGIALTVGVLFGIRYLDKKRKAKTSVEE
ncbi:MAG: Na+/H+ antiporter NhaC family protein [Clostridia bacterium]|nr:Na+/H+ antiporter NhaC family protein [Clostridia bacterium]